MQVVSGLLIALAAGLAKGDDSFEPADFDITSALLDHGVNLSALPQLAPLTERSFLSGCSRACSSLEVLYGVTVIPKNTSAYANFTGSYWSQQQAAVDPYCIVKPTNASQISVQVLISRLTHCPFAVKSGGHAAFAGASSIEGGVTISLENFNQVTPSDDKTSVVVGPGNRWREVYQSLQPSDIVVIGGRVSAIGVGGLSLGGGISFFSSVYGWACDNVKSYELVTASGVILNVTQQNFPDLYWGLRGGGNNFGIVVSFTLNAVPLPGGLMWGGSRIFASNTSFPALIDAFVDLGSQGAISDPNAAEILSFTSYQGTKLAFAALQYAKPIADAPVFAQYLKIPGYISDTTQVRTLSNLTDEFAASNPDGMRETYWTAAYQLTNKMTTFVKDVFYEELPTVIDAAGIVPAATLQVITSPQIQFMQKNGGNPLGLTTDKGPLLLLDVNVQWTNPADDSRILEFSKRVIDRTVQYAQQNGLADDYLYMNYASQFQDVISSYGADNKARLASIGRKYDPTGVFQDLVPGGFKLDG